MFGQRPRGIPERFPTTKREAVAFGRIQNTGFRGETQVRLEAGLKVRYDIWRPSVCDVAQSASPMLRDLPFERGTRLFVAAG